MCKYTYDIVAECTVWKWISFRFLHLSYLDWFPLDGLHHCTRANVMRSELLFESLVQIPNLLQIRSRHIRLRLFYSFFCRLLFKETSITFWLKMSERRQQQKQPANWYALCFSLIQCMLIAQYEYAALWILWFYISHTNMAMNVLAWLKKPKNLPLIIIPANTAECSGCKIKWKTNQTNEHNSLELLVSTDYMISNFIITIFTNKFAWVIKTGNTLSCHFNYNPCVDSSSSSL